MKNILKSVFLLASFSLFFASCQNEENQITTENPETLTKASPLTSLLQRVVTNDTSIDNIIDSTSCFKVKLPIVLNVNNQGVDINSEEDYHRITDIFNASSTDHDYAEFVFPITVVYPDYSEMILINRYQYEDLKRECQQPNPNESSIPCIKINYPVTIYAYDSNFQLANTYTINNDVTLFLLLLNLNANEYYAINYPITVTLSNNQVLIVRNNIELMGAIQAAMQTCNPNGCTNLHVVTNGLIIYMPFANEARDLISGDLASGTPVFITDRSANANSAVSFNGGTQDFLRLTSAQTNLIEPGNSVTMSLWFKAQNTEVGDFEYLFEKTDSNESPGLSRYGLALHDSNKPKFYHYNVTGFDVWDPTWELDPNNLPNDTTNWHHLAVTIDNTNPQSPLIKLYRDGILVNQIQATNSLFVNTQYPDYLIGRNFKGYLDDLRVYRRTLSAEEINTLFTTPGDNNNCLN